MNRALIIVSMASRRSIATAFRSGVPLFWIVYHRGHRIGVRRIQDGFEPTPLACPICKKTANDGDLRYDLAREEKP